MGNPSKIDKRHGGPIPLSGSAIAHFIEMFTQEINKSEEDGGVIPSIDLVWESAIKKEIPKAFQ